MSGLHIGVDASRTTRRRRTGTENYSLQVLRQLLSFNSDHHFTFYFRDDPPHDLFPESNRLNEKVMPFPRMWTHLRLAGELYLNSPDVLYVPAHTLPKFFPTKAVAAIHDLGFLYYPETHPENERRYLEWSTKHSATRAQRIVTLSQHAKDDLINRYGLAEEKINVAYPAYDDSLHPIEDANTLTTVREKYDIPTENYLIFVGTLQPRKNIERLANAYHQWRQESGREDVTLVLAGQRGWLFDEGWTDGIDGIHFPGYIADEDINALYSGALALTFPSLFEGFGLPVVEAMACGTAVLTSNTTSLLEIGEGYAHLVDPENIDDIAAGIDLLVSDEQLRRDYEQKGLKRAQDFSWRGCAEVVMQSIEEASQV